MNELPVELMNINQLGERLLKIAETPAAYPPGQLKQIAQMIVNYKFGILVGLGIEGPNVTAISTIDTPYDISFWFWEEDMGYRQQATAYRDSDFEATMHDQANMLEEEEGEDED